MQPENEKVKYFARSGYELDQFGASTLLKTRNRCTPQAYMVNKDMIFEANLYVLYTAYLPRDDWLSKARALKLLKI